MIKATQPIVIVDADSIVAQVSANDSNHKKTFLLSEKLKSSKARIIYPVTAILEAVTVLQKKESSVLAHAVANLLMPSKVEVVQIDDEILTSAMIYFEPTKSKKNTLFDCIIMAIADDYETDIIFSFDKFYKKQGYRLVGDL